MAAKTFRQDLYFRLNGITLTVPPLRSRLEEIEPLARQFLNEASAAGGGEPPALSTEAVELLRGYSWPGNIRELRNMMERALVLCEGDRITGEHLPVEKMRLSRLASVLAEPAALATPPAVVPAPARSAPPGRADGVELPERPSRDPDQLNLSPEEHAERQQIMRVMEACAGSQTRAAARLGISRGTLIRAAQAVQHPATAGAARLTVCGRGGPVAGGGRHGTT